MDHHGRWEQLQEAREEAADLLRRATAADAEIKRLATDLDAHDRRIVGLGASASQLEADLRTLRDNLRDVA